MVIDANGIVYAGGVYSTLYAIDPVASSSEMVAKWSFSPDKDGPATSSTPALARDGTLYVGYCTGRVNGIFALNPDASDTATREKWFYPTKDINCSSPIVGLDATAYIGSYYHDTVGPLPQGGLYAFGASTSLQDPHPKWFNSEPRPNSISPAIGMDGTVYVAGEDGILYAFDAHTSDGHWKWRFPSGGGVAAPPVVAANGTIYLATNRGDSTGDIGYLVAADPNATSHETRTLWSLQVGKFLFSLALALDGTVYVGSSDGSLFAIDPSTVAAGGGPLWTFKADGAIGGIAIGADGLIYAASADHRLYALSPDGSVKWKYQAGDQILASPAIGADGTVFVVSDDGYLYAFGP